MLRRICLLFLPVISTAFVFAQDTSTKPEIPVATQWVLDGLKSPAQKGAVKSVLMIVCRKDERKGTGFALEDGAIIATNSHVVGSCKAEELEGTSALGKPVKFSSMVQDENRDLALLCPTKALPVGLQLGAGQSMIETEVETWGYPLSYLGFAPVLSRGYVAGFTNNVHLNQDGTPTAPVKRLIVNGAFNPGNSGGPLVDRATGKVVGVVVAKWTLFSPMAKMVILGLQNSPTRTGSAFTRKGANGQSLMVSNEEAIAAVLEEFYNLSQVMVGEAISVSELDAFLKDKRRELACHE